MLVRTASAILKEHVIVRTIINPNKTSKTLPIGSSRGFRVLV